jgi:putative transposase
MTRELKRLNAFAPSRNQRLSPEVYAEAGIPVSFTLRAYRGRPFAANPDVCAVVIELLRTMRREHGCWVGAYCLMPDHLHFIAGTDHDDVSVLRFVDRFKGRTTNASWEHGWEGRLWQKRSHDHVIRQREGVDAVSQYILENPVRAGLVAAPEDWPWSGIIDDHR